MTKIEVRDLMYSHDWVIDSSLTTRTEFRPTGTTTPDQMSKLLDLAGIHHDVVHHSIYRYSPRLIIIYFSRPNYETIPQ